MNSGDPDSLQLSGLLLAATPALQDPHFRRTILLLSHHSAKEGAVGLVINRPLHVGLGDLLPEAGPLAGVPIFYGGPVAADQPILAGLRWGASGGVEFQNFGTTAHPSEIPAEWHPYLRLYVGHSGWSPGQLENEIKQKSWFVLHPVRELIEYPAPEHAWRFLLRQMSPLLRLLAEAPENPELN